METMLKAENVWFRYSEDGDWALKGINVEIKKGEFVAILGSNGCGKSTLAKHFNAILTPDKGDVTVLGMNTKEEGCYSNPTVQTCGLYRRLINAPTV